MQEAEMEAAQAILRGEQTAAVERLVNEVEDVEERIQGVARLGAEELDYLLDLYNWDDGFAVPTAIATHPECERALALRLFWRADGLTWYTRLVEPSPYQRDWGVFCELISEGILSGRYPVGALSFDPELSRVQLYKLRKAGIPEALYQPIVGTGRSDAASEQGPA
jgi:hypothetical protein